jgi:hypothetical protein
MNAFRRFLEYLFPDKSEQKSTKTVDDIKTNINSNEGAEKAQSKVAKDTTPPNIPPSPKKSSVEIKVDKTLDSTETTGLELRMYGLVPYNISPIQQGIQFGHGVVEYGINFFNDVDYQNWAKFCKTFIILNGGTSNHTKNRYSAQKDRSGLYTQSSEFVGSMENNLSLLNDNNIKIGTFYEPDLNDMLSAIVFIVDERVFDRVKYPDFNIKSIYGNSISYDDIFKDPINPIFPSAPSISSADVRNSWIEWVDYIGGIKNAFLRDFLKNFKFA